MPTKATTLSNLIEIDSEDDFARPDEEVMLTPDSAVENKAIKARRKPATTSRTTSKVTKPRATTKKPTASATARLKRSVLLERKNLGNVSETEEAEENEEAEIEMPKAASRGKAAKSRAETTIAKVRKATQSANGAAEVSEEEVEIRTKSSASRAAANKSSKTSKAESRRAIPETQPDATEVTELSVDDEEEQDEPTPKPFRKTAPSRARSISRQRQTFRRAGSASDTERAGDPALRRKLGDITRQLESMQLKYNNLREIGMRDADSNFDKLRKTTEQRAKAQDEIIVSLRKELALQKSLAAESKNLRSQVTTLTSENAQLASNNSTLMRNFQDAQTESKNLSAKLAAARASSAPVDTKQVPGSAVKRQDQQKSVTPVALEVAMLKLKEELYGDLTGLILNGVKKLDGEDIYDCIQTGRNGTLHFHISISSASSNNSVDYADAEFAYTPLLDEKNDRDLIDILPDYLTEEICFPRSSASKFYAKVVDCMTKKVVIEE